MEQEIRTSISGSFKFKPEIDATREILEECGVVVLEPAKGWIIMPASELASLHRQGQIRPLPSEEGLLAYQIEERFLRAVDQSSFLYIMNVNGYVGVSTAYELGYAVAKQIPVYAFQELDFDAMEMDDIGLRLYLTKYITVLPPDQAPTHYLNTLELQINK